MDSVLEVPAASASPPAKTGRAGGGFGLARRLKVARWVVPALLVVLVVGYEAGPSRWLSATYGDTYHLWAEILIYGAVGPVIAFGLLDFLGRWLAEKETAELQSRLLSRARERVQLSEQLSDRALQELFAASMQLCELEAQLPNLPPEAAERLRQICQSFDHAIRHLRDHLMNASLSD
jgi:signal transduction histidine kinase